MGRYLEVYKRLSSEGLKCDFYVTSVDKKNVVHNSGIVFNKWLPYEQIVYKCCHTRCILDIIQPGQDGETYRQGEAVAYGVKLLTNYENVTSERYYRPDQIKVFSKADDIDIKFIKQDYDVDQFPYDGCLSPYMRLEWLDKVIKEKEQKQND